MLEVKMGCPDILWDSILGRDIGAIIQSGWVSIGEWVEALEERFKKLTGCKYAIATNSATTGLVIAIKAAGWKASGDVHMPAFTWPSTLYAVKCNGHDVRFHDIDRKTWLMDCYPGNTIYPDDYVIQVDVFGNQSTRLDYIEKENIIIDAAHGFGLPELGKRGIAEVVSLSFTKIVTAMEGGMILTDDDELAETAIELRRLSGRMGEINARIALQSIDCYGSSLAHRKEIVNRYCVNLSVDFDVQESDHFNHSVFSVLFTETSTRNAVMKALSKNGIETKVYYDPLCEGLVNTNYVYSHILSLPVHNGINVDIVDRITDIIAESAETTPGKKYLTAL